MDADKRITNAYTHCSRIANASEQYKQKKKVMKKIYTIALAAMVMAACGESGLEERASVNDNAGAEALLQVRTRTGDETTVSYPVQVYLFQSDECRAVQTIGDAGQALNIALTEGTYSVYAVSGAGSADYDLPAKGEATTTTALTLKEGKALTDLMAATATATLSDGGTNTVTLGLQRKTMLVEDVTIRQVPSAATAVSVTIAPLWQSLTVGGTYSGTAGSSTINLTKQSDGRTWKAGGSSSAGEGDDTTSGGSGSAGDGDGSSAGGVFLLPPSSEPASVGVSITLGGATKTYTYSTTDELAAGYRISIDGTYTEAIGVNLTGTITGAAWLGQRTISFTFDESGSAAVNGGAGNDNAGEGSAGGNNDNTGGNNNDNNDNQDNFPAVGGTYQGCYVLAVDVADGGQSAELTILSPNEQAVTSAADVETKLPTLGSGGISGWDVPTSAQLKLIEAQRSAIANAAEGKYYLYRNADGSKYYYHRLGIAPDNQSFGSAIGGPWPDSFEILLRPVAVVTVAAE